MRTKFLFSAVILWCCTAAFSQTNYYERSKTFYKSGYTIPYQKSSITGKSIVGSGSDNNYYFYAMEDLITYLKNNYFTNFIPVSQSDIQGKTGIIYFKGCNWDDAIGHIDIWNGSNCMTKSYFDRCNDIYFWELKN